MTVDAEMTPLRKIVVRSGVVGGGREPLICAPLVARTPDEILAELALVAGKHPDLIEWRADFFRDVTNLDSVLRVASQIRAVTAIPLIFTLRAAREGGEPVALTDEQILGVNAAICEAKLADIIDFEMSGEAAHLRHLKSVCTASDTRLILSYHNFLDTPDTESIFRQFLSAGELGADIAKIAVMSKRPEDVLTLLAAAHQAHRRMTIPLIAISMGSYGIVSRTLGWMYGSSVTFAVAQGSSAPGQPPIDELTAAIAMLKRLSLY